MSEQQIFDPTLAAANTDRRDVISCTYPESTPQPPYALELLHSYKGFVTGRGSVYAYDLEGKTTRFKTATGELSPRQDIAVFVALSQDDEKALIVAIHATSDDPNMRQTVHVVEKSEKYQGLVDDIDQVADPDGLHLIIVQGGQIIWKKKASVTPVLGQNVFDMRHYKENGKNYSQRHLGNKVVEVM